jgi:Protein of unknown function (DUF2726)
MPLGGRVLIEIRNMKASRLDKSADLAAGDYVLVSVADTGEGMSEAVLARACEPFYTTKEPGKGSGLERKLRMLCPLPARQNHALSSLPYATRRSRPWRVKVPPRGRQRGVAEKEGKSVAVDMVLFAVIVVAVASIVLLLLLDRMLLRENRQLHQQLTSLSIPTTPAAPTVRVSNEEQQDEYLERQLEAVTRETVKFSVSRVMRRGEFDLFRAALGVTGQPFPSGTYPFYVFPQVSLGEIIHTAADDAHSAINSKRCDLLIADRGGYPVAVLEYQGGGHNTGGTAERRDRIKRIALEKAGVRYVEIKDGTSQAEIQTAIRELLAGASRAVSPIPALRNGTLSG